MSMYNNFRADEGLETGGIRLDYGSFRVTIARAGGANKAFTKLMDIKSKPYRRAIQTNTIDESTSTTILYEAYAEAIIKKWEVKSKDDKGKEIWSDGIENEEGDILPYTKDAVIKAFNDLPELFIDIHTAASDASLFRQEVREIEAGN